MREEWEHAISSKENANSQPSDDDASSDAYCFELLSMVLALSGSNVGRQYLAQQLTLLQDLFSLLHTASPRVQRQVGGTCRAHECFTLNKMIVSKRPLFCLLFLPLLLSFPTLLPLLSPPTPFHDHLLLRFLLLSPSTCSSSNFFFSSFFIPLPHLSSDSCSFRQLPLFFSFAFYFHSPLVFLFSVSSLLFFDMKNIA